MNNNTCKYCGKEFIKKKNGAKVKYCSDKCYKDYRREYNRIKMRKANPPKHSVDKVCEHCGDNYEALPRGAHSSRFCSAKCNDTWWSRQKGHRPLNEWISIREEQKRKRQARLELERKEKLIDKECEWCGCEFKTTEARRVTCSSECSRKRLRRIEHLRKDKRINETNLVDRDITLERLFERDEGICYICNAPCDYDDKTITDEGYFIAGETYPSIDHVYPLARGGMHSWDNVRLAHHSCNGEKSDNLVKGVELLPKDIAYSLARKVSPRSKVTIQLTRQGKEINRFNSTAEAERKTGIKQKGIQNCARGETKTYRGYIWRYA